MQKIKINLSLNSYEIWIGDGLLEKAGEVLQELGFQSKTVIITNPLVKDLYGNSLRVNLEKSGLRTSILSVPDGEEYKSLEQAGKLYLQLNEIQAERSTPILALGGGVIGDLAGFVASTYMRGVPLIQIPTTLLAQVDSSIGGKVAVNHSQMKNNIGAFYQPRIVLSDTSTLKTLPKQEFINGMSEIIKYGIICDKDLFRLIENNLEQLKSLDAKLVENVISRCAGIKASVVEKDEKDLGLRNILNYGHTVGHAVESVSGFQLTHGQGVAIGMVAAGLISQRLGILADSDLQRIQSTLLRVGLPVKIPGLPVDKLIQAMKHDKKKVEGKIRFVLPKAIGEVFIQDEVSVAILEQALRDIYEEAPDLRHDCQ